MVHRVTTSDNEWQRVTQQVSTSGTTSDNEWSFRLILLFFRIREESTTKLSKGNSLNLKQDLEETRDTELRAKRSS